MCRLKMGTCTEQNHALCTARGLSQAALADMVGATRQTINAIEQEKYAPSLELAFRIAEAFELPFERIWSFKN